MQREEYIKIRGAEVNNLKSIDVDIPRNKLVVITGVSGSGKSSLAFDTLFAEGQRRFAESISSFARQFLGRVSKPAVEEISGIPPAIAIEQKVNTRNPRSTVGTITELYDYLRVLFAKIGKTYSPVSGRLVTKNSTKDVSDYISSFADGTVLYILSDLSWRSDEYRIETLLNMKEEGFSRLLSDSEVVKIDTVLQDIDQYRDRDTYLMIDRITKSDEEDTLTRTIDSVNTAFEKGNGRIFLFFPDNNQVKEFSNFFEADGIRFETPNEWMFNFNNPLGACPHCGGFGKIVGIDEALVIPDPSLSLYQGAIACWRGEHVRTNFEAMITAAPKSGIPLHTPYIDLRDEQKKIIWEGDQHFMGINPFFEYVEANRYKIQFKYMLHRYSGKTTCPECKGSRLRKESLYVKIGEKDRRNIAELLNLSIEDLYNYFKALDLSEYEQTIASRAIKEIDQRLSYIMNVGLSYLTLNRASNTLSGGESQRINLVSSLGNTLTGSMYILDEPSIGLHSRDTKRLIGVLESLRNLGNSVIVVEHDEEIMRAADEVIDIGPYAGSHGGEIVFKGKLSEDIKATDYPKSQTIQYLTGAKQVEMPTVKRRWTKYIEVIGARENNLKNISVKFPLGVLTAVTGVSGSGKSSLVGDILYPAVHRHLHQMGDKPGLFTSLGGDLNKISSVEYVDQNPIGRSTRSNPVTYLKVYDDIRKLFSDQPYAKANSYGHSHFSFNIDGGRCPECQGEGVITIDMQFMPDVQIVCEACEGKRFLPDILEVKYKGLNISDILNMSVGEAIDFFSSQKEAQAKTIAEKLKPLNDVGLTYVQLGQSSSTLSGGESQRVKLASFLAKEKNKGSESILFIFDEPTTGLHFDDINKLLKSFNALIDKGHTIVVVEHNTQIIKAADWIINLGPDAGDKGGEITYEGN